MADDILIGFSLGFCEQAPRSRSSLALAIVAYGRDQQSRIRMVGRHRGSNMLVKIIIRRNAFRVEPFRALQRLIPDPGHPNPGSIGGYGGHVRGSRRAHRLFAMQQPGDHPKAR
jgi:hypothetical protein